MGSYEELIFYQKARQLVNSVDGLIKSLPKTMQAQEIARQLFRPATSVGANIAEGHGRHQGSEYIHYLSLLKVQRMKQSIGLILLWIADWVMRIEPMRL